MAYHISAGVAEDALAVWLQKAAGKYGTFKDGRVDYTHADMAPTVMCIVKYGSKLLLLKRGYGLADAQGYWSTVSGFIDTVRPVADQARIEIKEELGLNVKTSQIHVASSYTLDNPETRRTYIVFPCLLVLDERPQITLDEEHTEYKWIHRDELESFHILEDLPYAIDTALGL